MTITTEKLTKLDNNIDAIEQYADTENLTFVTTSGKTKDTIEGKNRKADKAIAAVGGTDIGDYSSDLTFNNYNEYVVFDRAGATTGPSLWKAKSPREGQAGTPLPYTINSAANPDPANDTNIEPFGDANILFVQEQANTGDSQIFGGNIHPIGSANSAQVGDTGLLNVRFLRDSSAGYLYETSEPVNGEITALDFSAGTATIGGVGVNLNILYLYTQTVNSLKAGSWPVGAIVVTKGYYQTGDKGSAEYLIVSGNSGDGYGSHDIGANTAQLQVNKTDINLAQWGARGVPTEDDLPSLNAAYNWAFNDAPTYVVTGATADRKSIGGYVLSYQGIIHIGDSFTFKNTVQFHLGIDIAPSDSMSPTGGVDKFLVDTNIITPDTASIDFEYSGTMYCRFKCNGMRNAWTLGCYLSGNIFDYFKVGMHCDVFNHPIYGDVFGHEFALTSTGRIFNAHFPGTLPPHVIDDQIGLIIDYPDTKIKGTIQSKICVQFNSASCFVAGGAHLYGQNSIQCGDSSQGLYAVNAYFDAPNMILKNNADIKNCTINCDTLNGGNPGIIIPEGFGINVNITGNLFHGVNGDPAARGVEYGGSGATSVRKNVKTFDNTTRTAQHVETYPWRSFRSTAGFTEVQFDFSGVVDTIKYAEADYKVDSTNVYRALVSIDNANSRVFIFKQKYDRTLDEWNPTSDGDEVVLRLYLPDTPAR